MFCWRQTIFPEYIFNFSAFSICFPPLEYTVFLDQIQEATLNR